MNKILHYIFFSTLALTLLASCGVRKDIYYARKSAADKVKNNDPRYAKPDNKKINNKVNKSSAPLKDFDPPLNISRKKFVDQSFKYLGTPYLYGGNDPKVGIDCSGFIHLVFKDFGYSSPRISYLYAHEGKEVKKEKAKIGDIILFTTKSTKKSGKVGHMGIITSTYPNIKFIHAASSKGKGVMESELKGYFIEHFVKIISVLQ